MTAFLAFPALLGCLASPLVAYQVGLVLSATKD